MRSSLKQSSSSGKVGPLDEENRITARDPLFLAFPSDQLRDPVFDFFQYRKRRGFSFTQRTYLQNKDAIRALQLQNILCPVLSVFILYAIYSVRNDSIILHSCLPFWVEANSPAIEPLEYFPGADWWSSRRVCCNGGAWMDQLKARRGMRTAFKQPLRCLSG